MQFMNLNYVNTILCVMFLFSSRYFPGVLETLILNLKMCLSISETHQIMSSVRCEGLYYLVNFLVKIGKGTL